MSVNPQPASPIAARSEISLSRVSRFIGKSAPGFAIVTSILALYGIGRVSQATPAGMGLGGDSYSYVTAADNLAAGRGFGRLNGRGELVPTTHYPPFYPVTLAGLQMLGVDKIESARWVNFVSFIALVFLTGIVLRRETGSNYPGYAVGAILVTSPIVFGVSVWAMSEPLYLALGLAGLWILSLYLEGRSRWFFLSSVVLIALGYFTRYIGISLVGTAVLALLLQRSPWRKKILDAGLLLLLTSLPVILWWIRNASLTGNFANRRIIWHPITYVHLKALVLGSLEWFVPAQLIFSGAQAIALILIGAVFMGALLLRMRAADRLTLRFRRGGIPLLLAIYTALYLLALGASLSLFDPFTQVDDRILSPVYVSVMLLAGVLMWEAWGLQGKIVRGAILAGLAFMVVWNGATQARLANSYGRHGLGNASPAISQSQTVAAVRELPELPIVSNGISRLYFWADRNSFAVPWLIDLETEERDPAYEDNLQIMRGRLCDERGFLVLFYPERLLPEQAPLSDLTAGLVLYGDYPDGEIYRCQGSD